MKRLAVRFQGDCCNCLLSQFYCTVFLQCTGRSLRAPKKMVLGDQEIITIEGVVLYNNRGRLAFY